MSKPVSLSGQHLFKMMPEVYRNRDNGDLATYLDACGELLDLVRHTLDQRQADCFPDNPPLGGDACQPWLLPYFADLLDVRLLSPDDVGRREEISNAVSWRQRKGTFGCVEEIAQSVGQFEVEVQEGWKRIATTARIGMPLQPFEIFGESRDAPDMSHPSSAATHPALPAVTVDMRLASRAVEADTKNPAARRLRFDGDAKPWRQANAHGVPCFAGSYEDASLRTVDVRTPEWNQGHIHAQRLLLYARPYDGFFAVDPQLLDWSAVSDPDSELLLAVMSFSEWVAEESANGVWPLQVGESGEVYTNISGAPLHIQGDVTLTAPEGEADYVWLFEGLVFEGKLTLVGGTACFRRCAVKAVEVVDAQLVTTSINAIDSLFDIVTAPKAWCRFEYCTVLSRTEFGVIQASDSIFGGELLLGKPELAVKKRPANSCVRYSTLPVKVTTAVEALLKLAASSSNCRLQPRYQERPDQETCSQGDLRTPLFGEPGCGVLHIAENVAIRSGAEDGGEMGAYHHRHYCLRQQNVIEKLKDYLPFDLEPVMIPDVRLTSAPPAEA